MSPKKQRLEDMDFSAAMKGLNSRTGDIVNFQSYVSLVILSMNVHKNREDAEVFYGHALEIVKNYSKTEMPEMHSLLRQLKREYKF